MVLNAIIKLLPIFLVGLSLAGCQPTVYLMPPPVALEKNSVFFELTEGSIDENLLYTLYATNRQPFETQSQNRKYTFFPSEKLRLGYVVHSIGEGRYPWEEVFLQSVKAEREKKLPLKLVWTREQAVYDTTAEMIEISHGGEGFYEKINEIVDKAFDKDIIVYVHGANSSFYRGTAQGAQFFHYTGHNVLVLTFSWPSTGSLLNYNTDVANAGKTVPAFAKLIQLLAQKTKAQRINIIGYSAGAQIVAPGLAYLRDMYPDMTDKELKAQLRIGEVYFAAPDTPTKAFVGQYTKFRDIVDRTTLNINTNDSVLFLAAFNNGVSSLGKPDTTELSEAEQQIIIDATKTDSLDVLDISGSEALNVGSSHSSWYTHPWVSNDLLLLFLFKAEPEERGLTRYSHESGFIGYHFPEGYDDAIRSLIRENRQKMLDRHNRKTIN